MRSNSSDTPTVTESESINGGGQLLHSLDAADIDDSESSNDILPVLARVDCREPEEVTAMLRCERMLEAILESVLAIDAHDDLRAEVKREL